MELISYEDVVGSYPIIKYLGGKGFLNTVFRILKWKQFEKEYFNIEKTEDPVCFANALLKQLDVTYTINEQELLNIPKTGPFIVMANHPFGGIDGVILAKILGEKRADVKILVNSFLSIIKPLDKMFITVNPFDNAKGTGKNILGIKNAMKYVRAGNPLAVFPAGQVSSIHNWRFQVADIEWKGQVARMCKQLQVPVIPVYFAGENSFWFHALGLIHPILRTIQIPAQFMNKRGKNILVRIGTPILPEEFSDLKLENEIGKYFRDKVYKLKDKE